MSAALAPSRERLCKYYPTWMIGSSVPPPWSRRCTTQRQFWPIFRPSASRSTGKRAICSPANRQISLHESVSHSLESSLLETWKFFRLGGLVTAQSPEAAWLDCRSSCSNSSWPAEGTPLQCWFSAYQPHPRDNRQVKLHVFRACTRSFLLCGGGGGSHPHRRQVISTDASLTG